MKKICFLFLTMFLLLVVNVFAGSDVLIDVNGDIETGSTNPDARLEVNGDTNRHAVMGITDGAGAGIRGDHSIGHFGMLGGSNFGAYGRYSGTSNYGYLGYSNSGVYGYGSYGVSGYGSTGVYGSSSSGYGVRGWSSTGYAGYFQGNTWVTGNLHVVGSITGYTETDPVFSGWDKSTGISILESQVTNLAHFSTGDETDPTVNLLGKASLTCTNNQVAKWSGTLWACADDNAGGGASYQSVAVVAQSGGDYTSPLDAMNNLSTWCGVASSTNPCLIRIMPGIYNLGNNGVIMQSYVDIEGSGENVTTITSTHSSISQDASSATLIGANNAEIRFLTVENKGSNKYSIAIFSYNSSPDITNITATALGGTDNYGVFNWTSSSVMTNVTATASGGTNNDGVFNRTSSSPTMTNVIATASGGSSFNNGVSNSSSSSPTMTNVTATASGGTDNRGVLNDSSSPTMTNVTAIASGVSFSFGIANFSSSSARIINSSISGPTSIMNSTSTSKVGGTMLEGGVSGTGFTCVGAYDETFVALSNICQ